MADAPSIVRADEVAAQAFDFRHPLDGEAQVRLFPLSRTTPLERTGVTLAHLEPGRSSYPQHRHLLEEEWIFIFSGSATLQLDDDSTPVAAGDFAAFPAGGAAHKLTNTGGETLVYLMGGERRPTEIVDFPEQGLRLTRHAGRIETAPLEAFETFAPPARKRNG